MPISIGGETLLRNVYFASGSTLLDDRSRHELQRFFDLLEEQSALRICLCPQPPDDGKRVEVKKGAANAAPPYQSS